MQSSLLAIGALLLSAAVAQPHKHHAHQHHKRDIAVVWETEWVVVTETINLATTIWVDGSVPASASASSSGQPGEFYETSPAAQAPASTPIAPPAAVQTTLATSVYVAPPAPTPPTQPPVVIVPPPSVAPVVVPVPTEAPVIPVVVPTPSQAPVVVAVAPSSAAAPPPAAASSAPATGGSTAGGTTGKATFYDTATDANAPGSCGWANDGTAEYVLAFPAGVMGAQSNGNPYCGKMVSISYGGKTIQAKIVDKCPGCANTSIDLSRAAFSALASQDLGHIQVTWSVIN